MALRRRVHQRLNLVVYFENLIHMRRTRAARVPTFPAFFLMLGYFSKISIATRTHVRSYKAHLRRRVKCKYQAEWDQEIGDELDMTEPLLSECKSARHRERSPEVIICRLRVGHIHLTQGYLLYGVDAPTCE